MRELIGYHRIANVYLVTKVARSAQTTSKICTVLLRPVSISVEVDATRMKSLVVCVLLALISWQVKSLHIADRELLELLEGRLVVICKMKTHQLTCL